MIDDALVQELYEQAVGRMIADIVAKACQGVIRPGGTIAIQTNAPVELRMSHHLLDTLLTALRKAGISAQTVRYTIDDGYIIKVI